MNRTMKVKSDESVKARPSSNLRRVRPAAPMGKTRSDEAAAPNESTKKALDDARNEHDLTAFAADDFFASLDF